MRFLVFIFTLLLFFFRSEAQFLNADHKKAEELKHRPLIVALFDPAEEAKTHCDSLHMVFYNEHIRKVFSDHWKLSDSIIFMRSKRVASIIAAKSNDYVIFSAGPSVEGQQSSSEVFWFPSFTFMLYLSEDGKRFDSKMVDRALYSSPLVPDIEMTGHLSRGKYIFKLSLYEKYIAENDLIFVLTQFSNQISEALKAQKTRGGIYAKRLPDNIRDQLKTRTLLIPLGMDPEVESEQDISRYYNFPFRLTSHQEIERTINEEKADYAYIHYLWSDHQRMFQAYVIDAETKEVLSVFKAGNIEIDLEKCLPAGTSYRKNITFSVKRLKAIY